MERCNLMHEARKHVIYSSLFHNCKRGREMLHAVLWHIIQVKE